MVRFRSKTVRIFVAFALVLFMSSARSALAHASPAAKAFSAQWSLDEPGQDQGQGQNQEQGQNQDLQDDHSGDNGVNEGPSQDFQGESQEGQEGQQGEVAEMDGAHDDGDFHEGQVDEDRTEDQQNDDHQDVAPQPPAA